MYHGFRNGSAFVAARTWEGALLHEAAIEGVGFCHATGLPDGRRMVVDRRDGMVSLLDPGAPKPEQRLKDLCRHDTTYEDQDAHGHPLAGPDGRSIVFTSNRSGHCQVYEVAVPTDWRSDRDETSTVTGLCHASH